jgi:uncharacterized protein YbdZ (MbtH family)
MAWGDDEEDTTIYQVVVNHEEQYSIWPEYKEIPGGGRTAKSATSRNAWITSRKSEPICVR